MASTSKGLSAAPPAGGKQEDVQTTALKDEIYNASVPVANDNPDFVFHQDDFFGFDIIPNDDVEQLMKVLQALVNEKLFKLVSDGTLGWKVRSEEDAKKSVSPLLFPRFTFLSGRQLLIKYLDLDTVVSPTSKNSSTPSSTKLVPMESGTKPSKPRRVSTMPTCVKQSSTSRPNG